MTPKQADQIIKNNKPVTVHNPVYNETFTALFVKRDRFSIYTNTGGVFERGDLVKIAADLVFHRTALELAESALMEYLQTNGQMTVAQFRDLVKSSRKYVVPLLEYFDAKRVTRRMGDQRVAFK